MFAKKFNNFIAKIKAMNFNKKVSLFLVTTILATITIIMVITSISAGTTITSKSSIMAMRHIESIAINLDVALKDFNDIAMLLISDSRILKYTRAHSDTTDNYIKLSNDAYDAMVYIKNAKRNIDYLALLKYNDNTIQHHGKTWMGQDLFGIIKDNYKESTPTEYGNMKVDLSKKIFGKEGNELHIYQPVYDPYELNKQTGLICIGIDEAVLRNFYEVYDAQMPFDIYITDAVGKIISHEDHSKIFTDSPYKGYLKGTKGSFQKDGQLIVYNYIDAWNWYIVGTLPTSYLLSDTYNMIIILLVLMVLLCAISITISFRLSNSLYQPLKEIVDRMSIISTGDLRTRMNDDYKGQDFKKMANGFNFMVEQLENLIQRVKDEQDQIKKIELNALQSQIKPHFLYNTLECIHWQALADGSEEVSTMVKALAKYYRICLSKGRDIIPLYEEIAHVENYLVIQNMRYGDIIESDFRIDSRFNDILIPKMTLQPLVENSIYHGIKVKEGYRGKIVIRVREDGDDVIISVADNGTGMSQEKIDETNKSISIYDETFGYGVRNVHKRIEILFGEGYGLFYYLNAAEGITVDIRLSRKEK